MPAELTRSKLFIVIVGLSALIYSVLVMGYVGTSPDIGIRSLLSDSNVTDGQPGIVIRQVINLTCDGQAPAPGDTLLRVSGQSIHSFMDLPRVMASLRSARVQHSVPPGTDLALGDPKRFPPLLQKEGQDGLWVEVEYQPAGSQTARVAWVVVKSLPLSEVLLSFVWLILQLGIFALSALAAWHRPFDRAAWLFFSMCGVSIGGFIGGFHWWVLAANPLLSIPFVCCAVLVPSVSLHFYMSYPRALLPMIRWPRLTTIVLYTVPAIAAVAMTGLQFAAWLATSDSMSAEAIRVAEWSLTSLRYVIYVYLAYAAACFFVMLFALSWEFLTSSSPVERNQMRWLLRAGLIATIPICFTLYLALFDRVGFALGRARLPMFIASMSFTLAYLVGIVRFKLMLVDQLVTRGMLYVSATNGLTLGYGACVALIALFANNLSVGNVLPGWFQQALSIGLVLTFSVVVLTWSRDRLQQGIDRRFYREKYQLDKALQRVNRSLDRMEDRHKLAQRMLTSCREVLGSKRSVLYLREASSLRFQLAASDGPGTFNEQFTATEELVNRLQHDAVLQRSTTLPGDPVFPFLRDLHCELIFALHLDDQIEGLVVLAQRQDGTPFSAEDLTFLHTMGQFTTVALRSVRVHQDFARLNEELQFKASKIDEQKRQIAIMQVELTNPSPSAVAASVLVPTPSAAGSASVTAAATEPDPNALRRDMIRGNSPAIREVLDTVRKVAAAESTVLIQGSSGTGKELLAQAIHENSSRRNGPLVRVHCAALSPSLLESELFGHAKGSFTGAHRDRVGRFEMAHGGTLFLDEIGDISLETQIKLLRVLQTRSFEPVGSQRTLTVDVRLITATHQNLQKMIAEGRFREDLFYRLNVVNIVLPTLHERRDDIFELALHFLMKASQKSGKRVSHIDEDALDAMKRYSWPGNIRELENVIERAVVLSESDHITVAELPPDVRRAALRRSSNTAPTGLYPGVDSRRGSLAPTTTGEVVRGNSLAVPSQPFRPGLSANPVHRDSQPVAGSIRLDEMQQERLLLEQVLEECRGNKSLAARRLGVPRSTLFSRLKKAGLT